MANLTGRRVYTLHKWCGLIGALFIFILGITGSILVFNHELDTFENRDVWYVQNSIPNSIDKAYKAVIKNHQNWDIRLKRIPSNINETFIFNLRKPSQKLTIFVHPSNGLILKEIDSSKTFVSWLLKLHYTLHAKLVGEVVVFIFGIIYFISLVSGCIIYRKALVDVLMFRIKFRSKKKRSIASTLHRYVGVWALSINLIIVFTGLLISYDVVSNGFKSNKKQEINYTYIPTFSIDRAFSVIKNQHPDFEPTYIRFPTELGKAIQINGIKENELFFYSQYYNTFNINPESGELLNIKVSSESDFGTRLSSFARGVHFVEFGNIWVKIIFCLMGLSAPVLTITGFFLWKWRRRRPQ